MYFLSNTSDKHLIDYLRKSDSPIQLVPVQRLVNKPGKKPFLQIYWVQPHQVQSTDKVITGGVMPEHTHKIQLDAKYLDDSTQHYQFIQFNTTKQLLDKNTKVNGFVSSGIKNGIQKHIEQISNELIPNIQRGVEQALYWEMDDVTLSDFNNLTDEEFTAKYTTSKQKWYNEFYVNLPDHTIITPHIDEIDNETFKLGYNTNIPYDSLNEATKIILTTVFGKSSEIQNVNGTVKITVSESIQQDWSYEDKITIANQLIDALHTDFVAHAESSYKATIENTTVTDTPITDRERDLFLNEIMGAPVDAMKHYRASGICTNPDDITAQEYIQQLAISRHAASGCSLKLSHENYSLILNSSFNEIKDMLNDYNSDLDNYIGEIPDREIKSKIETADEETTKTISQQILSSWDMINHKNLKPIIHNVFKVTSIPVEEKFQTIVQNNSKFSEQESIHKNCQVDQFFHGTNNLSVHLILGESGQFEIGKAKFGRMLGDGVYVADVASKSAQYLGDEFINSSMNNARGTLMIVEASLGKCHTTFNLPIVSDETYKFYDSIGMEPRKHKVLNNEWCIFNNQAVKPKYLIDMTVEYTE